MTRTSWTILVIAVLPIIVVTWMVVDLPTGQSTATAFAPPPIGVPPEDEELREGWTVFTTKGCVYCHGPEGKGGVKNPNAMGGEVPAIQADLFSFEEFEEKLNLGVRHVDQEESEKAEPPLYMPSWRGKLTDRELEVLWAYLESFVEEDGDDDW